MKEKEVEFNYVNKNILGLIIIISIIVLWILTVILLSLFFGTKTVTDIIEIVCLSILLAISFAPYKIAIFKGKYILKKDRLELNLRFKKYTILYSDISKVRYYTFKRNYGLLIKMGFFRELDIKSDSNDNKPLFKLYTELKKKIKN
jgi:hypothetical protein